MDAETRKYRSMIFVYLLLAGACAVAIYLWRVYTHFSRRGLRHGPAVPLFGDMGRVLLKKEHLTEPLMRSYTCFPGDKFVGRYEFMIPYVVIRDPELLKKVTVKDFEYFIDRKVNIDAKIEPLMGRNLVSLRGDEWKDMRSALSPAFTSSKIRQMVPFMVHVGEQMIKSLKTRIQDSGNGYIDLKAYNLTTRYANDVIATCAFGIDINSQFEDNEFYDVSRKMTTLDFSMKMRFLGFRTAPWLMSLLKLSIFPEKVKDFYSNVVLGAIKQREEMHIYRPDMIHLLMEAKKGRLSHDTKTTKDDHAGFATVEESDVGRSRNKRDWTDLDLVAQAVIFLLAGFDTVSIAMAFLLYELAVNPDCQDKLVQEIRENEEKNGGKFDYNSVQHMKYLDMVVSETLRKWPGAPMVDRLCVQDYNLGKPNDKATKDFIIRKGEAVQIAVWAFHRDPKYFPEPDKFDPERFSDENKHNIDPFVYMPFGQGPRNCIGSRFALCEVKVMVYQLFQHFEVSPCEKTVIPMTLCSNDGLKMTPKGGNWLRFQLRK